MAWYHVSPTDRTLIAVLGISSLLLRICNALPDLPLKERPTQANYRKRHSSGNTTIVDPKLSLSSFNPKQHPTATTIMGGGGWYYVPKVSETL